MKTMKKGIALLLSVMLCVGLLSVGVLADSTDETTGRTLNVSIVEGNAGSSSTNTKVKVMNGAEVLKEETTIPGIFATKVNGGIWEAGDTIVLAAGDYYTEGIIDIYASMTLKADGEGATLYKIGNQKRFFRVNNRSSALPGDIWQFNVENITFDGTHSAATDNDDHCFFLTSNVGLSLKNVKIKNFNNTTSAAIFYDDSELTASEWNNTGIVVEATGLVTEGNTYTARLESLPWANGYGNGIVTYSHFKHDSTSDFSKDTNGIGATNSPACGYNNHLVINTTTGEVTDLLPAVAKIGETPYGSLAAAIAAAQDNDTVTLLTNISFDNSSTSKDDGYFNIAKPLTIDGNGYTITATAGTAGKGHVLNVTADGVTIKNLTIDGGKHVQHAVNAYLAENVTLSNLTLKNSTLGICVNASSVTASNIVTSGNGWGGINVDSKKLADASLAISGDATNTELVYIDAEETYKSTITISGGKYTATGINKTNVVGDSISITGGTFSNKPAEDYVASGYGVRQSGSDYIVDKEYTVTYSGTGVNTQTTTVVNGSATPTYNGTPSYPGFIFAGWSPAVAATVTGNATYTAQWIYYDPTPASTEPETDIPEEETPLAENPEDGEDAENPEEGEELDIEEETVPLAELPEDFEEEVTVEIDGEEVPLAEAPITYEDVSEDDWYRSAVAYATWNDIMIGTDAEEGTTFDPEETSDGNMITAILYRVTENADTGESWDNGVDWAAEDGLTDGIEFDPDAPTTREQLVTMIYRMAQKHGFDVSATTDLSEQFTDADELSDYAQDAMAWAVSVGLIKGMGDGTVNGGGELTRAQIAAIFMRFDLMLQK